MCTLNFKDTQLEQILERATEPKPQLRTESASTFANELRGWLRRSIAEKEMPTLPRGLRWICRSPIVGVSILAFASQLTASVINITYNHLQIVSKLTPQQNQSFMSFVGLYNAVIYPTLILFVAYTLRALFQPHASVERKRASLLRAPWVAAFAVSAGWLPGSYIFPRVIDYQAGPIAQEIYWQFMGSFSLSWLISMTTSLAVIIFVLARALYPRYWDGQHDVAIQELRPIESLNTSLTFAAALIPLAGVLMVVVMAPNEFSHHHFHAFKMLILATVSFGLLNLLLVQRLTQFANSAVLALKRPRSFD